MLMKTEKITKPKIKLIGMDGNAFAILAAAHVALQRAGLEDMWEDYQKEAIAGDYDHLLMVTMKWFEVT